VGALLNRLVAFDAVAYLQRILGVFGLRGEVWLGLFSASLLACLFLEGRSIAPVGHLFKTPEWFVGPAGVYFLVVATFAGGKAIKTLKGKDGTEVQLEDKKPEVK